MSWFERLIDPFPTDRTPPPQTLWAFLRWSLRGTERAMAWVLALALVLGFSEAVGAVLIGWVVDQAAVLQPSEMLSEHGLELGLILVFFLAVRPALMIVSSGLVSRGMVPALPQLGIWRLHRHTLGQSLEFFENDFAGRISQKQMQSAVAINDVVVEFLNSISFGAASLIGAMVVLAGADARLAAALALWFAAYLVWIVWHLPRLRVLAAARAEARAAVSGQLVDSITNITTVKLFAHAEREEEAAHDSLSRYRVASLAFGRQAWVFRSGLSILAGILPAGLIALGIWLWAIGDAGPGTIAMAAMLSTRLSQMSGWISFTAMGIFANLGVAEDGMRTLSPAHGIVDAPDAVRPLQSAGALRFEAVHFRYGRPGGGGLHGLSLDIEPGERVALVGRSGAGKSTVIRLLARLHDVEEGRILLDGVDLRELAQNDLRRQIAVVTQETAMFNRSALDNILYGQPDAGREAAIAAAKAAEAHDFITGLRDYRGRESYDAYLGERGVKLSGGQRQRIALARAILKDAPILVLDEATSALDSEAEAAIQRALGRLMEGKTVLAIAHRLSTIRRMDRIVVLDAGRIAEEGAHDALLAEDGLYAQFWQRQAGEQISLDAAE